MSEGTILTLNAGSSSLKFALFAGGGKLRRLWSGVIEAIGLPEAYFRLWDARETVVLDEMGRFDTHEAALVRLLAAIERQSDHLGLAAVGHRVAHGGPDCDCPKPVTPALLARLHRLVPLAPLHLQANIAGIEAVRAARPDLMQVACFDTAFHHGMPRLAQLSGLPRAMQDAGLRRYGYHGLSYEYILGALRDDGVDVAREKIIVAHLGNGASMCAIRDGKSIETTMGFSTLAGLPMGTRSGDVDPGLLLHLLTERQMTVAELSRLLYAEAGLLGLSGLSRDMKDLLARPEAEAAEAVAYFCYHARRHLAGLTAALGGLDRVVFTGGVGANAPQVRAAICAGLGYLGITLERRANAHGAGVISAPRAPVTVEARQTDEEAMIAGHVRDMLATHPVAQEA